MMFSAATLLLFASGAMGSISTSDPKSQIRKCIKDHNLEIPEFFRGLSHEKIKNIVETACSKFPAFFECAKDPINAQMKAWNPTNPVTAEEINQGFGTVCGKENQEATVCFFEKGPGKKAEHECRDAIGYSSAIGDCDEKKNVLKCALPKVRESSCGAKAADIMDLLYGLEIRTMRHCK